MTSPQWDAWVEKIADAAGTIGTPESRRAFADAALRSLGGGLPTGYDRQMLPSRLRDVQAKSAAALAAFRELRAMIDPGVAGGSIAVFDRLREYPAVTAAKRVQGWSEELESIEAFLAGIDTAAADLSMRHQKRRGRPNVAAREIVCRVARAWYKHFREWPKPSQHNGDSGPTTRFDKVCAVIEDVLATLNRNITLGPTSRRDGVRMARKLPH